jgi:hypothetical protein
LRNNFKPNSDSYLSVDLNDDKPLDSIDIYHIMSAAGRVEYYLGLTINRILAGPARIEFSNDFMPIR